MQAFHDLSSGLFPYVKWGSYFSPSLPHTSQVGAGNTPSLADDWPNKDIVTRNIF